MTAVKGQNLNDLGLVQGLRTYISDGCRCANCGRMQRPQSTMVWVPDSVRVGDPAWAVAEICKRERYNGNSSGWCMKCARKLGRRNWIPLYLFLLVAAVFLAVWLK